MSDEEAPVRVVDRRSKSKQPEPEQPAAAQPVDEQPAADEPEPAPADETPENGDEQFELPDPTYLLTIAAMQMDTQALIRTVSGILDAHAWRALGLVADPRTGEPTKDLPTAQLAIDCVQFLFSKVEQTLPDAERRDAQRRLTDLRMNYLAKSREG